MVRTGGRLIIHFMTGEAIGRGVCENPADVASSAIIDQMASGQRKKQVIGCARRPMPIRERKIMAVKTIGRIPCILVIGCGSSQIGIQMAIHALISYAVKAQSGFRCMAIIALCQPVISKQGKPITLV